MFDYEEAKSTKEDILLSEQSILKITRHLKNYKLLRLEELRIKAKLHKTIREVLTNLANLDKNIPKIKAPPLLKHHFEEYEEHVELQKEKVKTQVKEKIKTSKQINEDDDIEEQIRQIQEKLRQLKV